MTKAILRTVEKQPEPDFTQQPGEWQEPADEFADGIAGAMAEAKTTPDIKTLVERTRTQFQRDLDKLTHAKASIERRIAEAHDRKVLAVKAAVDACEAAEQAALSAHRTEMADAETDLAQIAACREALDLAVGRLNKA